MLIVCEGVAGWSNFTGANYGKRARDNTNYAANFFRSILDKTKLVDPVKDRGNSNFKQVRFKAAIADYSTAIKLRCGIVVLFLFVY